MLKEINYLQIITVLIGLLFSCSLIFSIVIEAIKKLMTEEKIKQKFGSLEFFSLIVSFILGVIVFMIYILFFVIGTFTMNPIDIIRFIFIGIIFILLCGVGSQIGYDKLIKVLKEIFHIN